jgi:hypothetical protein
MKKLSEAIITPCLILALIIQFVACSKETSASNNNNNSAITVQNLAGTYSLTALTVTIAPLPPQSIIDSLPTCQRDDLYKLNSDMSFNYVDNGIKCVPPGNASGNWSLSSNTIIIDTLHLAIKSFDGKTLTLTTPVSFNGFAGTTTETLVKQ